MMNNRPLILGIEQGATCTRSILLCPESGKVFSSEYDMDALHPQAGHVEFDPEILWLGVRLTINDAIDAAEALDRPIAGIGISNQTDTAMVWERESGDCIYNAIASSDKRTRQSCEQLLAQGLEKTVQDKTGLPLDHHFAATKWRWIIEHAAGNYSDPSTQLMCGTVDTWLLWRLTGGRVFATDATNASRSLLYNIHTHGWDEDLAQIFGIDVSMLPVVKDCAGDFGQLDSAFFRTPVPLSGVAASQQAAAVGQGCSKRGMVSGTLDTTGTLLLNTGSTPGSANHNCSVTIALQLDGQAHYGLLGTLSTAGAGFNSMMPERSPLWSLSSRSAFPMRDCRIPARNGMFIVPGNAGKGIPNDDPETSCSIYGLGPAADLQEIIGAVRESVCFQVLDLLYDLSINNTRVKALHLDGSLLQANHFAQHLADIVSVNVHRACDLYSGARGAAYLAGLATGIYASVAEIVTHVQCETIFIPDMDHELRRRLLYGWFDANRNIKTIRSQSSAANSVFHGGRVSVKTEQQQTVEVVADDIDSAESIQSATPATQLPPTQLLLRQVE